MTNTIFFQTLRDDESCVSSCPSSRISEVEELPRYSAFNEALLALKRKIRSSYRPPLPPQARRIGENEVTNSEEEHVNSSTFVHPAPQTDGEILECSNLKRFNFFELEVATMNFHPSNVLGNGGGSCSRAVFKGWIQPPQTKRIGENEATNSEEQHVDSKRFNLSELEVATMNFHSSNVLDLENTFRSTLASTELHMGSAVAVKKVIRGDQLRDTKWVAEIKRLAKFDHPNLVKVVGYCLEREHLLVVSEFIPEASFEDHFFNMDSELQPLSWNFRMKVALDAAKGLAFLHNVHVIHGVFKPSNILLDWNRNAKLSDFGLAKVYPNAYEVETVSGPKRHYGFMSEYSTGDLTARSDVYSFGVVLLEMLLGPEMVEKEKRSGRRSAYVERAKLCLYNTQKRISIDNQLDGQYSLKDAKKAAQLALRCLNIHWSYRLTMNEVVAVLETIQSNT